MAGLVAPRDAVVALRRMTCLPASEVWERACTVGILASVAAVIRRTGRRPSAPATARPGSTPAARSSSLRPWTARSPGGLHGGVRQAEPVGGGLLRAGDEDGCDHPDLSLRSASGWVAVPASHALWSQSQGSGGSARRIVIGRSVVAWLCLSPRPFPHAAPVGALPARATTRFGFPVLHLMHSFLPRHEFVVLEGASRSGWGAQSSPRRRQLDGSLEDLHRREPWPRVPIGLGLAMTADKRIRPSASRVTAASGDPRTWILLVCPVVGS